eukprot:COSAG01_NODE_4745_length_4770_cov_28.401627_5_plen_173_part_00
MHDGTAALSLSSCTSAPPIPAALTSSSLITHHPQPAGRAGYTRRARVGRTPFGLISDAAPTGSNEPPRAHQRRDRGRPPVRLLHRGEAHRMPRGRGVGARAGLRFQTCAFVGENHRSPPPGTMRCVCALIMRPCVAQTCRLWRGRTEKRTFLVCLGTSRRAQWSPSGLGSRR